jgi:protein TonB
MAVAAISEDRSSFLRNCLVEGDSAEETGVRRNQRRALLLSIVVQFLIVAALVIFPLFTKGENIASRTVVFPATPYSPGRSPSQQSDPAHPRRGNHVNCRFCAPPSIPPTISTQAASPIGDPDAPTGPEIPGVPDGPGVPGGLTPMDSRHEPPPPVTHPHATERRPMSEPLIAAKLVHRVEPIYPPLGVQLRREGRVELRAIISTDGSIQSLEVIAGDPIFIQSALSAVRQWRYQPTILDGQPVEIDTHITVIYTLAR